MTKSKNLSMQKASQDRSLENQPSQILSDHVSGRLLQDRLELVEDLWETVVRSECPLEQADRLLRLKKLSNSNAIQELVVFGPSNESQSLRSGGSIGS